MSDSRTQTQQVYAFLKDAIYNCRYLPGQEISEKQLFEELSFGRTPIRETLLQLQTASETLHYTGYFTQSYDRAVWDVADVRFPEKRQQVVFA